MKYTATFALLAIFSILPGVSQTGQTDSQTLQAILAEMRAIHTDVRLSETTQILLTELEVQQTAVNRAMQKRDNLRNQLSQSQANQKNMAAEVARFDDSVNAIIDPAQKKELAQNMDRIKSQLVGMKSQEQDTTNVLQDAEAALRMEQDTLAGIQDQLNDVVKKLQPVSSK
jgi:chromosome segregation ATPase